MVLDPVRNFAIGVLKTGISAGDTSITLQDGQGDKFPPTSEGSYNCVIWNATDYSNPADDPNVEIVRVTSRSGDTFTVQRGQEGTSAVAHNEAGKTYKMMLAFTRKSYDDIDTWLNKLNNLGGDLSGTIDNATVEAVGGKSASEIADAVNKRHAQNTDRLIKDADGDTSVDTETSADEDKIRFKTAGSERVVINNDGKIDFKKNQVISFVIENRTSDPSSPVTGQIWFRTDV